MPTADEAALVAVVGRGTTVARTAVAAWDAGEAVLPVDPGAPAVATRRLLERLRATHRLDEDGRRAVRPDGVPVAAGTAAVIVTSGTTGEPKGVDPPRAGLAVMGRGYSAGLDATPADRWLACLPLHHVAAL